MSSSHKKNNVFADYAAEQVYGDIIDLPRPVSRTHPPRPMLNRAAQFAPFAALTGYDAAVEETARLTEEEVYLDESEIAALNEKLARLEAALPNPPAVQITCFRPDERKSGGSFETVTGRSGRSTASHNVCTWSPEKGSRLHAL